MPQQLSPTHPLADRDARRRPSPCRRASRSTPTPPTARPPAPTPRPASAPTNEAALPGVRQGRQPRDRQLGAARRRCPASSTSASRCPATATGSSSSPTASPPTSSWRARSPPTRRPASSSITFTEPAAEPADRLQHALLRLRARPPGDPDPVRHLPGHDAPSRPGTRASPNQTSTQFFTLDSGPERRALPRPAAALRPELRGRRRPATPPAPTAPSRSTSTRDDGDQNLSRPERHHPAGLLGDPGRDPLLLRGGARRSSPTPATRASRSRPTRAARPPRQIGTATAGAGAGTHPLYVPGKVYLAGPYKGAPLSLAVVTPAVSGPYDLGNVVVRAALHVDPTDRPGHRGLRSAAADPRRDPAAAALDPGQPRPARTSPSTRPTATRSRSDAEVFGDQGGEAQLERPTSRSPTAPTSPSRPKLALQAHRRRPSAPATRRSTRVLTASPGEANIARAAVTLPHARAARQRPHRGALHEGRSSPHDSLPGRLGARQRQGRHPAARPAARRHRSTCDGSEHKLPDLVADLQGPGRHRPRSAASTPSTAACAPPSKRSPTPRSPSFTLNLPGGSKGLIVRTAKASARKRQGRDREDDGPERQARSTQTPDAADALRQGRSTSAPEPGQGGALSDANYEERAGDNAVRRMRTGSASSSRDRARRAVRLTRHARLGRELGRRERTFDSQIARFNGASSVAFDANGNVWITDMGSSTNRPGQDGLYKYDAYPSQTLLDVPNTYDPWGYSVGTAGGRRSVHRRGLRRPVERAHRRHLRRRRRISSASGARHQRSRRWPRLRQVSTSPSTTRNTYSRGRVYLSLT